jgi:CheY-like chemotaxis protein
LERIEVAIKDTGIGMRPEDVTRIFEAFVQGDHATTDDLHRFGGLGLGLTISQMVVTVHNGTIRATSAGIGEGATFVIDLPLTPASKSDRSPVPDRRPATANKTGQRLLLVEDHGPTRTALERLLIRRKFSVTSVGSLAEARACLASGETFSLLVSDIGLPDGTGYDLMKECARDQSLKGIALSGYGMDQDVARSRAAGFSAHLIKPIDVQALDKAIEGALRDEDTKP